MERQAHSIKIQPPSGFPGGSLGAESDFLQEVQFCCWDILFPPTLPVSFVSSCPWANILWGDTFLSANKIMLLMIVLLHSLKPTYKWENGLVPFSTSSRRIKNRIVVQNVLFLVPFSVWRHKEGCDTRQNKRAEYQVIWMRKGSLVISFY